MNLKLQSSQFNLFRVPFEFLSSKVFLIWILGGWIIFYVFSAIWMKEAFAFFVEGLSRNPFIQIPFVLFLVSGYLNLLRASVARFRKSRVMFLVWVILPAGILIFLTGFFLSITTRQFEWRVVGEGHTLKPRWSPDTYRITEVNSGLKDRFLDIDAETGSGFFKYEPRLTVSDNASGPVEVGAFPPTRIGDTYFHILKFGLAPGMRFARDGTILDEGYVILRILVPGSNDFFEIQSYPYRFLVSLAPEKTFQKGSLKASQFNLKSPSYNIRVFQGEKMIAEKESTEVISFEDYILSFFEPTYWVQLEVVRDQSYPVLILGILLTIIGLPLFLSNMWLKK